MQILIRAAGVLLVLAIAAPMPAGASPEKRGSGKTPRDLYEQGRSMIEAGNVEQALRLWAAVRDSLSSTGAEDPRIGRAFVEAVADAGLEGYGEMATDMFYWGLSANTAGAEPYRTEVLEEGRRTLLLVDSLLAKYWEDRGREDPVALALEIERFWLERDPTPTTLVNERLLEHWKRITDARILFAHNRSSPFRTDDRGVFHVKYGPPDRILKGTLSVSRWEQDLIGVPQEVIDRYDKMPQYEIWRYATMENGEFTYFMFGNLEGSGPYEHVEGLHKLIPSGARNYTVDFRGANAPLGSTVKGRRAHHYLEYSYYRDVAGMGGPYGLRADELDRLWLQRYTPVEGTMQATSFRFADEDRLALRQPRPTVLSDYDDSRKSALSAQAARILEGDEPRILLLAVSSPLWIPHIEEGEAGDSIVLNAYVARHTLIARDHRLDELVRTGMLPAGEEESTSAVLLRHPPSLGHLTVTAEHLMERDEDEEDLQEAEVGIGVLPGHAHFRLGPPLVSYEDESEVSDLIVGIAPQPGIDLGDLPVPLHPATRIWRNDLLRVYFEIYHPRSAPEGQVREYDVQVRLAPMGIIPEPAEERAKGTAAIEVTLESQAPTETHFFDLDLRNEQPGQLQISLQVTDRRTGTFRIRSTPLYLLER